MRQPTRPKPGHLYLRGRVWWAWYYVPSRAVPIRCSTHCSTRRGAEQWLTAEEERVRSGAAASEAAPYSVTQALQTLFDLKPWKSERTERAHKSRAGQIARLIGDRDLALLERPVLEGYIAARRDEGKKDHTIFKELVLLRLALKRAREDGHWSGDLAKVFPRHRANYVPRERWLTPQEAEALLGELLPHRRLWLQVALYTGARFDEINGLRWEDIDFARGLIRIRGTKTEAADRVVPLADELRPLVEPLARDEHGRARRGPVVRRWGQAGRDLKRACARVQVRRRKAQARRGEAQTAEFLPATPNDLRRTTASWMVQRGIAPKVIADWLGHKSLDMVLRVYARLNPESLRPAGAALPRLAVDCEARVLR